MANPLLTDKAGALCDTHVCRERHNGKPLCPLQKACYYVKGRSINQWAADVNAAAEALP